ncbi:hypothetical protein O181_033204 [Austropuccinia psidii MF-1]|uniref:Uncharacterized protein n=1 Tax=Austropuccinia psidii MF-1 TaxID=1389203 RepID=A0A9Q3CYS9_9BASI|nr:hypothetical protein [Austropuccinia psidii MF-1]
MYSGMTLYTWWGCLLFLAQTSLCLSRIPTLHTKILTTIQDPNASHIKPFTVNPYAREASRQCQQFLMLVQAPDPSHANPYACNGSQIFKLLMLGSQQLKQFLMLGKASNASDSNPYAFTGSQSFTGTSLCLYKFLTIQTIPYAGTATQKF